MDIEAIAGQVAAEWQMSFAGVELDFALEVAKRVADAGREAAWQQGYKSGYNDGVQDGTRTEREACKAACDKERLHPVGYDAYDTEEDRCYDLALEHAVGAICLRSNAENHRPADGFPADGPRGLES